MGAFLINRFSKLELAINRINQLEYYNFKRKNINVSIDIAE